MELSTPDARDGDSEHGLTWTQALVASGVLVASLAFFHLANGPPTTIVDWVLIASTAMFGGVVGYKAASRTFDTTFGVTTMLLVLNFLLIAPT